jgi:hypothetical protein
VNRFLVLAMVLAPRPAAPADLLHTRAEFQVTVHLPYAQAAPLFGAWKEQEWSPDWKPQFLYPSPPADRAGSVFKVEHGSHSSVWVTADFDLDAGHVQYVYVLNNLLLTRIDIHLHKEGENAAAASIVYERTALDPSANEQVRAMAEHDSKQAPEWQAALDAYALKVNSQARPR